jgi:Co/Zn/Cd efflux system component
LSQAGISLAALRISARSGGRSQATSYAAAVNAGFMRSVLLDTVADAAAAAGVALGGLIILAAGGLYWLDSAIALAMSLVVAFHAQRLVYLAVTQVREANR